MPFTSRKDGATGNEFTLPLKKTNNGRNIGNNGLHDAGHQEKGAWPLWDGKQIRWALIAPAYCLSLSRLHHRQRKLEEKELSSGKPRTRYWRGKSYTDRGSEEVRWSSIQLSMWVPKLEKEARTGLEIKMPGIYTSQKWKDFKIHTVGSCPDSGE